MDEMVLMYQREHARAHQRVVESRASCRWDGAEVWQQRHAEAFRQSWLWRYGNLMDLEAC